MRKTLRWPVLICFLILVTPVFAQPRADSLLRKYHEATADTVRISILHELFKEFKSVDPDKALQFANEQLRLSKKADHQYGLAQAYNNLGLIFHARGDFRKALQYYDHSVRIKLLINDTLGLAFTYNNLGYLYDERGSYDTALIYYKQSLGLSQKINDDEGIATALNNIGIVYYFKSDYTNSLAYYYQALETYRKLDDKPRIAQINLNIGNIYYTQKKYRKALDCYEISLKIHEETGNRKSVLRTYINISAVLFELKEYDRAIDINEQALKLGEELRDKKNLSSVYNNLGGCYKQKDDPQKAITYYKKSLKLKEELNDQKGLALTYSNLGNLYLKIGRTEDARDHYFKSLNIASGIGDKARMKDVYFSLSEVSEKTGDYKSAYQYHLLYSQLHDSIFNQESNKLLFEMQTEYETRQAQDQVELLKKESELRELQINRNRIINLSVILGMILLLIITMVMIIVIRQKQKNKILLMKQHAERNLMLSIIQTEEKERRRFAEDLHDGLGPLLSTIKLYLGQSVKETEAEERTKLIHIANQSLEEAINDTRSIANNIMPATIRDNGLINSLESFCTKVRHAHDLAVNCAVSAPDLSLPQNVELTLYRMIIELFNNTLKHARATIIELIIRHSNNTLSIEYTDNGIGFNAEEQLQKNKGLGLANIMNRAQTIDAECRIESRVNKGMKVSISLKTK